jgi:hypothetical protein
MAAKNKYRILIWVIAILVAVNLSMGISFFYHTEQDKLMMKQTEEENIEIPAQQRTRFFREQLDLNPQQVDLFRELNRDFNRTTGQIQNQLSELRIIMVNEMGLKDPDMEKLNEIAIQIGDLHEELKIITIEYYLAMKEVSTEEQQAKLHKIFLSVLNENKDIRLPQNGRRYRRNL